VRLGELILTAGAFEALAGRVEETLRSYHQANPLREGMPREELRSRAAIPATLLQGVLAELEAGGRIRERAGELALPTHQPRLRPDEEAVAAAAVRELESGGFSPPPLGELAARHRLSPAVLQYLCVQGRIVRINEDTAFARAAYDQAVSRVRAHLESNQRITVAQARDLLGSSRRYVLPLLEWFDAQKITRRVGDDRILRGR
jgi:selenocysteine-specific elongation factor